MNYGLDLLSAIGMAHGMVRGVGQLKIDQALRYVTDPAFVEKAIEEWQVRARRAIKSGEVISEQDIFVILYGVANLGSTATAAAAIAAFRDFCVDTRDGLSYFLEQARPYKEIQSRIFYLYVWNADEMAALVEASPYAEDFAWYTAILRSDPEVARYIAERNGKSDQE
ncbi:hypothetical protein [Paraburkholderia megapolitana]|uniref:hypothetical protein n=1 Tax=Paraburkholderia megapolitana TaxID=420953 RepID=UPI0038B800BB